MQTILTDFLKLSLVLSQTETHPTLSPDTQTWVLSHWVIQTTLGPFRSRSSPIGGCPSWLLLCPRPSRTALSSSTPSNLLPRGSLLSWSSVCFSSLF